MTTAKIVLLPGDGIGAEVVNEGRLVLERVAAAFGHEFVFQEELIGGAAIDAHGEALPARTLDACRAADAVLLGAVGGPKWDDPKAKVRPEQGLLALRRGLGLFANLRPVRVHPALTGASPLKPDRTLGTDVLFVRELTGGLYFGTPRLRETRGERTRAVDTLEYSDDEIRRVVKLAFQLARRRKKKVTSVDKANVLESSRLWREIAVEVSAEFPDIALDHQLVDSCAMRLLTHARSFDVVVTENMFGDILTDEAAVLAGSLGLLPSASLGDGPRGLYEPIHGSAPDIAGRGIANPIGTILSAAMLLRHSLDLPREADLVERAVNDVIAAGARTADMVVTGASGGDSIGTRAMGERVLAAIEPGGAVRIETPPTEPRTSPAAMFHSTDDLRIAGLRPLLPPAILMEEIPITETASATVTAARRSAASVLAGSSDRLLVVVGPCSIHDPNAALEYATRLKAVSDRLADDLVIVMRVYFEKPRTTVGWKGLINDPDLDGRFAINKGLRLARRLLLDLAELGLGAGTEFLDTITPQFIADLIAWGAIGARTTESQVHRELASGLSMPVGFKNSTEGDVQVAVDAVRAAREAHHFLSVTKQGISAIVATRGNDACHVILRGSQRGPNAGPEHVRAAADLLTAAGVPRRILIDCSHGNSRKDPARQPVVAAIVADQVRAGAVEILGVMLESHLVAGRQDLRAGVPLTYGQSITDACLSWDDTVVVLEMLAQAARERRAVRR